MNRRNFLSFLSLSPVIIPPVCIAMGKGAVRDFGMVPLQMARGERVDVRPIRREDFFSSDMLREMINDGLMRPLEDAEMTCHRCGDDHLIVSTHENHGRRHYTKVALPAVPA